MRVDGLCDLGVLACLFAHEPDAVGGDGLGDAVSRKEPGLEPIALPVLPQPGQEVRREPHLTIALAFTLAHVDDHTLGVDVGALKLTELGRTHAGGIEGGEDEAVLEVTGRLHQRGDLVSREDDGKLFGLLRIRDVVHHPRAMEGGLVEKAQAAHGLDQNALGGLLLQQMKLVGAEVFGAKSIR